MEKVCFILDREDLAENGKIYSFAMVWMQMYKNHAVTPGFYFEDIEYVGDGMRELGFRMDAFESLKALGYAENINSLTDWKRILKKITDVQLLGNAIYSQWRYWNHWAMAPMDEDDYQWFVESFARLAELTKDSY